MSYSPILEALPESLRQPGRLALIASVAFHGVAFAALPFLPNSSTAINSQRLVDLIELSAAEQNRLPQFSASQSTQLPGPPGGNLPPLGLGSLPPGLPDYSLEQPSGNPSTPEGLSPQEQLALSAPIITLPIRPGGPPQQQSTPEVTIASPPPQPRSFELPDTPNVPPFNPNKLPDIAAANPSVPPDLKPTEPFPLTSPPGNTAGTSPNPGQPNAAVPAGPEARWLAQAQKVSGDPNLSLQEKTVSLPYPKEACDRGKPQARSQVLALVNPEGKLTAVNRQELRLIESTGYPTLNAAAQNPENYKFTATGQYEALLYTAELNPGAVCAAAPAPSPQQTPQTGPQAAPPPAGVQQLLADARKKYNTDLVLRPEKVSYTYPKAACEEKLRGLASVVAIANPNGSLAESPKLAKSTGNPILDSAALEAAANHRFAAAGEQRAYIVSFGFEHTKAACAGNSTAGPAEKPEKANSQPAAKTPAPSPASQTPAAPTQTPRAAPPSKAPTASPAPTPGAPIPEAPSPTPAAPEASPTPTSEPLPELESGT